MATPRNIQKQINQQESMLLRQGRLASERFDQIRQRHIWSTFHFYPTPGGAIIGNVVQTGKREVFKSLAGQNGQGLPGGFQLSELDTNTPSTGRVSDNQNFSIWELGVTVRPCRQDVVATFPGGVMNGPILGEDMDQICENTIVSIKWLTNEVPLGIVSDYQQPGGPDMTVRSLLDSSGASGFALGPPDLVTGGKGEGLVDDEPWGGNILRMSQNSGPMPAQPALRRKFSVPIYLRNGMTFSFLFDIQRTFTIRTLANGGTGGFVLRLDWWAVESFRESA